KDVFGSSFFTLTGFHGFHVILGILALLILLIMRCGASYLKALKY
ncbi:MAG: cytochrome c oxidase subunit 3, partial [Flavobacteriaceae bacterium]|nr:cytochrome c oxidase subunit 3 [Flavobacteriaceae bacterium]